MSTLYSSFNASISGLNANATRLSAISDNIANTGTAGYKRLTTSFHSLVLSGGGTGAYMAGGVRATNSRLIGENGALTVTGNATDLAVNGRGFLPVTTQAAIGSGAANMPLMLMTTGSFRPDSQGILRNETGMVLLGWPTGADGTIGTPPRDSMGSLQPIQINRDRFTPEPTTEMRLRVNLPATETRAGSDGAARTLTTEYYSALGTTERLGISFTPDVPATGSSNTWTLQITNPADGNAVLGEYSVAFADSMPDAGRIVSVTQAAGAPGGAYDPATGALLIDVDGQEIAIDLGRPGQADALSQMASSFEPVALERDGAPIQSLIGVEVDANGYVRATYDSGLIRTIAQVPLVDVPNPNGLEALDNQAFRVSAASGPLFLWNAGDGPTGQIVGNALEGSTTDVAAELTSMIQTQRAYSSNAKVIQTVDEMLQETTNMKR
ncbi:MAG: flagellar hook protein FlgE [Pararhodobacter sp.]